MNAQLANRLAQGWTSVENFIVHAGKHSPDVANALGRASISSQEYAALARAAQDKGALFFKGGSLAKIMEITVDEEVKYGVAVVDAVGNIISFTIRSDIAGWAPVPP